MKIFFCIEIQNIFMFANKYFFALSSVVKIKKMASVFFIFMPLLLIGSSGYEKKVHTLRVW